MKYQIYLLYYLCIIKYSYESNNTDVIITYAGHSDIERPVPERRPETVTKNEESIAETKKETGGIKDGNEGVVFIPNDKPIFRNEDIFHDGLKLNDRIGRSGDSMLDKKVHITETESPKDILFISGKNKENINKPVEFVKKEENTGSTIVKKGRIIKNGRLNCTNLDCNNTVNSVCGGKEENKHWKYRLFLNECFFRKVNCGFQHAVNRYNLVPIDNCNNIGAHYLSRPYVFRPIPLPVQKNVPKNETRRSFTSRRSLSTGVDGSFCAHACPVSCTEDYDPQCAVSSSGQIKMFMNHCKLDHNSCFYKVVWHLRPLSQCVGGRKADMTQNRGFIGWMQRVGMLDRKGKLVLS